MSGPTDPLEPHFDKGLWGWDGTQWRKVGLLFSYSDRYAEEKFTTASPAGTLDLDGTAVPAGEVWRVTGASFYIVSASCTEARVYCMAGAVWVVVGCVRPPTTLTWYTFKLDLALKAGDGMRGRFYGMTLNDDAYVDFWGYKMKVA